MGLNLQGLRLFDLLKVSLFVNFAMRLLASLLTLARHLFLNNLNSDV